MSRSGEQLMRNEERQGQDGKMGGQQQEVRSKGSGTLEGQQQEVRSKGSGTLEGLPLESSPYVKYSDLEDYKRQAYGTEGHLEPVETSRAAGATEGPTLSGSKLSSAQANVVDSLHRQGAA